MAANVAAAELDSDDDNSSGSSVGMPTLEDQEDAPPPAQPAAAAGGGDGGGAKQNRAEKKNRKAMQKLGMKAVPDVVRVTVKKSKNILFAIGHPDVFKSATSDTYVVFGEAKIEDLSAQAQQQAASQFQAAQASMGSGAAAAAAPPTIPEEDEGGDLDESGLEPKDVELVMSQASCSRSKAVKALREAGYPEATEIGHLKAISPGGAALRVEVTGSWV